MTDIEINENALEELLKLTSKEFVKRIEGYIDLITDYRIRFVDSQNCLRVILVEKHLVSIYKFNKYDSTIEEVFFTEEEAELILTMFADVNLNV